ncbi:hypothetical protein BDQ12DRAFT_687798 [Crucibulum laeve]|uniref:F-box domain-containing protein n=1 Tax=Crucibulum laeve TaxID=68775 RepID=A0A5C3LRF0_9AGAR|nr:hypothetical protein BDQ12DRAFT_687798 [Crucibulum laeve]
MLPLEIYRPIFRWISDRPTLVSLSVVSKFFKDEAQKLLYHSFASDSASAHIRFLVNIVQYPHLALLVRSYMLYKDVDKAIYNPIFIAGLKAMKNLKELYVGVPADGVDALQLFNASQLRTCSFQLERFTWLIPLCEPAYNQSELLEFVLAQTLLQHFGASFPVPSQHLVTPAHCPRLTSLDGDLNLIEAIMPSRNITTLTWNANHTEEHREITHLKSYFEKVLAFAYGGYHRRRSLSVIAEYMPYLQTLELFGLRSADPRSLSEFQHLRTLIISRTTGNLMLPLPLTEHNALCDLIFSWTKSLQVIYITYFERGMYQMFYRDSPRVKLLSSEEVHAWWNDILF